MKYFGHNMNFPRRTIQKSILQQINSVIIYVAYVRFILGIQDKG